MAVHVQPNGTAQRPSHAKYIGHFNKSIAYTKHFQSIHNILTLLSKFCPVEEKTMDTCVCYANYTPYLCIYLLMPVHEGIVCTKH